MRIMENFNDGAKSVFSQSTLLQNIFLIISILKMWSFQTHIVSALLVLFFLGLFAIWILRSHGSEVKVNIQTTREKSLPVYVNHNVSVSRPTILPCYSLLEQETTFHTFLIKIQLLLQRVKHYKNIIGFLITDAPLLNI